MQKVFYGFGHIYNDLCAAMWFSYTLFYLQIVVQLESTTAGLLVMLGQVVDSLATPLAGCVVDRTKAPRVWHLAGTLSVAVGFTLIFSLKPSNFTDSILLYYGGVISLFQIGWAVVQISHLSILPEISENHAHSSDLTTIRYTASVCCNIAIYIIALILLKNDDKPNSIGPEDFFKFKEIALLVTFIGIIASLLFYCGMLSKPEYRYEEIVESEQPEDVNGLSIKGQISNFLKSPIIYQVSFMYMASRLFTTLNLIYIPLYLEEREENSNIINNGLRQTIATVPLVCFLSSFISSIFLRFRGSACNDKITYLLGALVSLIGSIWIGTSVSIESNTDVYIAAILIGIGGSSTMISSLCMTANFVKTNGYGGGSVYSTVTFIDKLVSGIIVMIVQNLQCVPKSSCPHFYEQVLCYLCVGVVIVGLLSLISLYIIIRRNNEKE